MLKIENSDSNDDDIIITVNLSSIKSLLNCCLQEMFPFLLFFLLFPALQFYNQSNCSFLFTAISGSSSFEMKHKMCSFHVFHTITLIYSFKIYFNFSLCLSGSDLMLFLYGYLPVFFDETIPVILLPDQYFSVQSYYESYIPNESTYTRLFFNVYL